jgi:hypothetical protein
MSSPACARSLPIEGSDDTPSWPLERVLFALAGSVTLLSVLLAALVSRWFLLLTAFVGVNQWLYVLVGACPASLVLRRLFALRSVVYPGRAGRDSGPEAGRAANQTPRAAGRTPRAAGQMARETGSTAAEAAREAIG